MVLTVNGKVPLRGTVTVPEGTWVDVASAARIIASATLAPHSDVTIQNVNMHPDRSGFLRYAILMGARITLLDQRWVGDQPVSHLHIQQAKHLQAIQIRSEHVETLGVTLPFLNVMAACAKGISLFPSQGSLPLALLTAQGVKASEANGVLSITGMGSRDCAPALLKEVV